MNVIKIIILLIFFIFINIQRPVAKIATHLLINAIEPEGKKGAKDEFIELYNPTDSFVYTKDLYIEIKGKKKELTFLKDVIPPYSYFLLASKDYSGGEFDATFTAGISDESYIALVLKDKDKVLDLVGFGKERKEGEYEGSPTAAIVKNKVLKRRICFEDTDNNYKDFELVDSYIPSSSNNEPFIPVYIKASSELPLQNKILFGSGDYIYKEATSSINVCEIYGIYQPGEISSINMVSAGESIFYKFSIVNAGNKKDTFVFDVQSDFVAYVLGEKTDLTPLKNIELPAGKSFDFYLKVDIPKDAILGEVSTATVVVKNKNGLGDSVSFTARTMVKEGMIPDLELIKEVDKTICKSKDILTYTIKVKNKGTATLNDLVLIDELPKQVFLKEVETKGNKVYYWLVDKWQEEFTPHARKLKIIVPKLDPNEELNFIVKVKVY